MSKYTHIPNPQFIMGALFVVTNKLDTMLERSLKEFNITSRQWFLSINLHSIFMEPPTIKQVAKQMGCSHQNAKQVALKLKEKGLLQMQKDENDQRVTRMSLTQESDRLWRRMSPKDTDFIADLFEGIDEDDLNKARIVLLKLTENLDKMDEKN